MNNNEPRFNICQLPGGGWSKVTLVPMSPDCRDLIWPQIFFVFQVMLTSTTQLPSTVYSGLCDHLPEPLSVRIMSNFETFSDSISTTSPSFYLAFLGFFCMLVVVASRDEESSNEKETGRSLKLVADGGLSREAETVETRSARSADRVSRRTKTGKRDGASKKKEKNPRRKTGKKKSNSGSERKEKRTRKGKKKAKGRRERKRKQSERRRLRKKGMAMKTCKQDLQRKFWRLSKVQGRHNRHCLGMQKTIGQAEGESESTRWERQQHEGRPGSRCKSDRVRGAPLLQGQVLF